MKKKLAVLLLSACCLFSLGFGFSFLPSAQVQASASTQSLTFNADTTFASVKPLSVQPKTYEATIKLPAGYTDRAGVVVGNWWSDDCDCFGFEVHQNGQVRLIVIDANKVKSDIFFGNTSVATGDWVHIAVSVDGANATLYINGAAVATKAYTASDFTPSSVFTLGGDLRTANAQYFKGEIKDVALFSDARTATEIAADYAGTTDYSADANLLCRYDLSDAAKLVTISDLSGNGYDVKRNALWVTDGTISDPTDYAYSFAIVGDTQKLVPHYANKLVWERGDQEEINYKYWYDQHEYPPNDTFVKVYDYIVNNATDKKIAHVFGLGDITERAESWSWVQSGCPYAADEEFTIAQEQINRLGAAGLDYSLNRGNHETWQSYDKYFGTGTESSKSNYTVDEVYVHPNGLVDYTNTIHYFSAGVLDYMVVTLDYGASDAILNWASERIAANPYKNVIITTHAYMYRDGTTLDVNDNCPPSKDSDGIVFDKTNINNGDDMWNELVSQHPNIVLTLSGHDPCDDLVTSQWKGVNGNVVTNMLVDPQGLDKTYAQEGCAGAVAMFYMSEDGKTAEVRFWSTARNCYIKHSNQFTVNLHTVDADYTVLNQMIAALPEVDALTQNDIIAVNEAEALYNGMSTENKAKVTNAAKLEAAIEKMQGVELTKHTVTWIVDGQESTSTVTYGETPVFSGDTYKYGYVFTGWSPAVTPVTGDVTYTAQYSDTSVWDGTYPNVTDGYTFSGQGSQEDPWLIQSATDLAALSALSYGKEYGTSSQYYKLTVNVDLTASNWQPICSPVQYPDNLWAQWYAFGANFDGDNHTVTLKESSMRFSFGFFGSIGGTVSNLVIDGTIQATGYSGGLTAIARGSAVITNVTNKADITATGGQVAGIIGNAGGNATVKNCSNEGNITSSGSFVAGIVGGGYVSAKLDSCSNSGNITGASNVAGIIGEVWLKGEVTNCTNSGVITAGTTVATEDTGNNTSVSVGNLIGKDNRDFRKFTITWIVNGEQTTTVVNSGELPIYSGTPTKEADAQYTYTFNGWDKKIVAADSDTTYTAQFKGELNVYIVTWVIDGAEFKAEVPYGELPVFEETPTKDADSEYTYTFIGWDKDVTEVTGDVTYTAEFEATPVNDDDSSSANDSSSDDSSSDNNSSSEEEEEEDSVPEEDSSSNGATAPVTVGCVASLNGGVCAIALLLFVCCMLLIRKKSKQ